MEATVGFEPTNEAFAEPSLNHLGTSPWPLAGTGMLPEAAPRATPGGTRQADRLRTSLAIVESCMYEVPS